jgi:hypothetical protein
MLATVITSHASDDAVESHWQWHYHVLLLMTLLRQRWSWHDVAAEATWLWRDVAAEATRPWRDISTKSCYATGVGIYDQSHDMRLESGCTYIISMYNG